MKIIWSQFQKSSSATNLALVALVAVLFMAVPQWTFEPLSDGAIAVFKRPFLRIKESLVVFRDLQAENERLAAALMQAVSELNELRQERDENTRLRRQLGFEPPGDRRLIPLEPISVEYRGAPRSIEVNKGLAQGVEVGLPVISGDGLVGRVKRAGARNATIQLLTDPECRVAVRVSESREQGIVRYLPSKGLILTNVPVDGQVKQGDLVISSGLGGSFPEGMSVGVVTSVKRDEDEIFAEVLLQPVVNFNAIDELYALAPVNPGDTSADMQMTSPTSTPLSTPVTTRSEGAR